MLGVRRDSKEAWFLKYCFNTSGLPPSPTVPEGGKSKARRRNSIVTWFAVSAGVVILVFLLDVLYMVLSVSQLESEITTITDIAHPLVLLSEEMEVNAIGSGLAVMSYLQRQNASHVARFDEDRAQFKAYLAKYQKLAAPPELKGFSGKIGVLYAQYEGLGAELIKQKDAQRQFQGLLTQAITEMQTIRDDNFDSREIANDPALNQNWKKAQFLAELQRDIGGVYLLLTNDVLISSPDNILANETRTAAIRDRYDGYTRLASAHDEAAWLMEMSTRIDDSIRLINSFIEYEKSISSNLTQFNDLRDQLDNLLDNEIQRVAAHRLATAQSNARSEAEKIYRIAIYGGSLGVIMAIFLVASMSRTIIRPLRLMTDATNALDIEKLGQQFNVKRDNEIGILANALNLMSARLADQVKKHTCELADINKELQLAVTTANEASYAKSQFLANMSHEMRTPLNAIIGFSDMLKQEIMGPIGNKHYLGYAKDINDSGVHLLGLISEILDVSRIEAGRVETADDRVNIKDTVSACMRLIGERAESKDIALHIKIADDLPDLRADQLRVKQILINLVGNAVKFTPAGGEVFITGLLSAGREITLSVADTGVGIAVEDQPAAMAVFGQVGNSISSLNEGTGLGLPLSKALAEQHGGKFTLQSEPGRGTVVTVTFPPERTLPVENTHRISQDG